MFTTPCFIKKISTELKEKLKELGYRDVGKVRYYGESQYIYCEGGIFYESPCTIKARYNTFIDCGTNEELFIAIASMTDDEYGLRDYYIVTDDYKPQYAKGSIHRALPLSSVIHPSCYRKATVEELIEHFKEK